MRIASVGVAIAILCVALHLAAGLMTFVDLASAAFIAVPAFAAFAAVGFKEQGVLIVREIAVQVGIVGMLIGFVGILQNVSDLNALGPAYALMLLVVFYGFILTGVCGMLSAKITESIVAPSVGLRVVSAGLWVVICALAMNGAAGLAAFIDLPSLLIVAALSVVIAGTSDDEWPKALAQYLPVAGFTGVLAGFIVMLQNMVDPKAIGPALAVAVLTLTYCNVASVALTLAYPEMRQDKSPARFTYLGFVLLFIMAATSVLLLSLA